VAVQFGLRPVVDASGKGVTLEPIRADEVRIERSYPAGRDAARTIAEWQKRAPQADIKLAAGRIVVRAMVEDHERLSPSRATRQTSAAAGQQVYTLTLEGMKLEAFLAQLEQKLSLSFDLAPDVKLDGLVNVDVKNATLDDLLRAAFAPLGLEFSRKDKSVAVRAKRN
ncbi:MAG TPA: STN domain-containing protein, partial [Lacipirellulaceae bacterium]|nr:STN domain-containing protein [Lacipirellulaceae bacterium]